MIEMAIDYKRIGARIRAARKEMNLTQALMSECIELSENHISTLFNFLFKAVKFFCAEKFSKRYPKSITYYFYRDKSGANVFIEDISQRGSRHPGDIGEVIYCPISLAA